jgi:hypothetical protein
LTFVADREDNIADMDDLIDATPSGEVQMRVKGGLNIGRSGTPMDGLSISSLVSSILNRLSCLGRAPISILSSVSVSHFSIILIPVECLCVLCDTV